MLITFNHCFSHEFMVSFDRSREYHSKNLPVLLFLPVYKEVLFKSTYPKVLATYIKSMRHIILRLLQPNGCSD